MLTKDFDIKTARDYKDLVETRAREIYPQWDQLSRADAMKILSELIAVTAASIDKRLSQLPDLVVSRMPGIFGLKPRLASAAEALVQFELSSEVDNEIFIPEQVKIMAASGVQQLEFTTVETGALYRYGQIHLHQEPGRVSIGFERFPERVSINLFIELERPLKNNQICWIATYLGRSLDISTIDGTHHFSHSGLVKFFTAHLKIDRTAFHGVEAYWIHGEPSEASTELAVRAVHPNVVKIANVWTFEEEQIGSGTGLADHKVQLPPGEVVSPFRLKIFDGERGEHEIWEEVQTLFLSGPDDRHFTIDYRAGKILFGDGERGRKAPPGFRNIIIEYLRVSDGIRGNIPITTPVRLRESKHWLKSIRLMTAAAGGRNCLVSDDLVHHMHSLVRNKDRAVTLMDYQDLAAAANPRVGRVFVREKEMGIVSIVVILKPDYAPDPESLDLTPYSTDLDLVRETLDKKRTLNTRLEVIAPDYRDLRVRLRAHVRALTEECRVQVENAIRDFFSPLQHAEMAPCARILREELLRELERLSVVQNVRSLFIEDMKTGVSENMIDLKEYELPRIRCELNFEEVSL